MRKKPTFIGFFLSLLVVVALAHLFLHFTLYGTGIRGFVEGGISGLAVDGSETDGESSGFQLPVSEMVLFLEWGLILMGVIFVYAKHKIDLKKEYHDLKLMKDKKHFSKGTELDNFFELLQEMKHFRLSTAAKVFDVDEEVIEDWAKSLETGRFAVLTYPRIGGPEIKLRQVEHISEKEKLSNQEDK
ncbi:MAG: hypothetical protein ABIH92_02415 [Nanoarchaeota archaeon]